MLTSAVPYPMYKYLGGRFSQVWLIENALVSASHEVDPVGLCTSTERGRKRTGCSVNQELAAWLFLASG